MNQSEVRKHFPERCVLVEALKLDTRGKERVIEEISVIVDLRTAIQQEDRAMATKKNSQAWAEAKKRCRLNETDIQMAKELGMTQRV